LLRIGLISDTHGLLRPQALNRGSAGPRRFTLPVAVGYLLLGPADLAAEVMELTL